MLTRKIKKARSFCALEPFPLYTLLASSTKRCSPSIEHARATRAGAPTRGCRREIDSAEGPSVNACSRAERNESKRPPTLLVVPAPSPISPTVQGGSAGSQCLTSRRRIAPREASRGGRRTAVCRPRCRRRRHRRRRACLAAAGEPSDHCSHIVFISRVIQREGCGRSSSEGAARLFPERRAELNKRRGKAEERERRKRAREKKKRQKLWSFRSLSTKIEKPKKKLEAHRGSPRKIAHFRLLSLSSHLPAPTQNKQCPQPAARACS